MTEKVGFGLPPTSNPLSAKYLRTRKKRAGAIFPENTPTKRQNPTLLEMSKT